MASEERTWASGWSPERVMTIQVLAHERLGPLSLGEMSLKTLALSTSTDAFPCPLGVPDLVVIELVPDGIPIIATQPSLPHPAPSRYPTCTSRRT